jgi:predicted RNA-binding protein with PIN domain
MDILIVDGYNVINAWSELNKLKEVSLDQARERLIQWIASYAGYKGLEAIIVFDAYMSKESLRRCSKNPGVRVLYSQEGETADSAIEKLVYDLVCERKGNVYVATADRAEQLTVLGSGAFRVSIRELQNAVVGVAREISERHGEAAGGRRTLEGRLQGGVIKRLEEIRRRSSPKSPEKR